MSSGNTHERYGRGAPEEPIARTGASPVDRQARDSLRDALTRYMTGAIGTFEFDERNSKCREQTDDKAVRDVSHNLWFIHDDFVDHPIHVSRRGWDVLRRVIAFLGTDLPLQPGSRKNTWPFGSEAQWRAHRHLLDDCALPEYDSAAHDAPIRPPWQTVLRWLLFVGGLGVILWWIGGCVSEFM